MVQDVVKRLNEYVETYANLWPFSGAVLVAREGEVLLRRAFGLADQEHQVPNTTETRFRVASVTKQFTATAVMILFERGMLDLQESVRTYLPEYPELDERIRIHHLLSHTSGLANFTIAGNPYLQSLFKVPIGELEFVGLFKDLPLNFPPGEKASYCNSGYYLLGLIISRLAGQSFHDFVTQEILQPVGMNKTCFDRPDLILPNRARPYQLNGERLRNGVYLDMRNLYPTGGLVSTVDDLLRWDRALYTEKILRPTTLEMMFTNHKGHFGYGWEVKEKYGRKMVEHNGNVVGFMAQFQRYLADEVCIAVLSNYSFQYVWKIADQLAAIALNEKYELPRKPERVQVDPAIYDDYVGVYAKKGSTGVRGGEEWNIKVTREGDRLYLAFSGDERFEVYPIGRDIFQHVWIDENYKFQRNSRGELSLMGCVRVRYPASE